MKENRRKVFNCWEIYFFHKRIGGGLWRGILQQRFTSVLLGSIWTIYILFQVRYAPFDQAWIKKPKAESMKEEGRFLAMVSWETKNLHPCDLLHRGITLLTLVILTNNLERNILIFFSRPRREIINLFVSCDLLFFSLVIFLLRIYLRYVFVVPKWNMLNHIVFFLHESI